MAKSKSRCVAFCVAAGLLTAGAAGAGDMNKGQSMAHRARPREMSIEKLRGLLWAGRTTSAQLVAGYEAAIAANDRAGANLHALIALDPRAGETARALDAARRPREPAVALDGIPILIKDNIDVDDGLATTAGSLALKDNVTGRDAPLVARLRAAGAVVLGKTNLSEWANFRSTASLSGWSAVGGQTRNARDALRSPCGSSSGSAVAVAAGFAAGAVGTETDGSITCPAAVNGVVGLKPTVGLVSRTHVVPISATQDTPGPIALTVRDAAILLTAMAGSDGADPATREADARRTDYAAKLDTGALRGARIGVMRFATGYHPGTDEVFEAALARLRVAGAVLVEIKEGPDRKALGAAEHKVLLTEFKIGVEAYLAGASPGRDQPRTLADLIAFNRGHAADELPIFGQELFEAADKTTGLDDPEYRAALAMAKRLAGPEGIDRLLAEGGVVALVAPTMGPPCLIDPVLKDQFVGGGAGQLAAVSGYPHLTVPMGEVSGLPVGLSFIGPAWSESTLLSLGYAFEQTRP
ncbi:MAG: amidase [Caulobacteraceae bacterium]|nr:amidase [Caulobacteraceae bacterium]